MVVRFYYDVGSVVLAVIYRLSINKSIRRGTMPGFSFYSISDFIFLEKEEVRTFFALRESLALESCLKEV